MRIVVPYTKEVLDSIIYEYQEIFWPLQSIFIILSLWIVYSIWKEKNSSVIVGVIAFFWIWIGAVYQINYYNTINWIGTYLGFFFIFQGLLLLWFGIFKKEILFKKSRVLLLLIFIIIFPLFELFIGIDLYELSIIGMLPNITVIFTVLLLILNTKRVWSIFILPLIYLIFSLYWNYLLLFS